MGKKERLEEEGEENESRYPMILLPANTLVLSLVYVAHHLSLSVFASRSLRSALSSPLIFTTVS